MDGDGKQRDRRTDKQVQVEEMEKWRDKNTDGGEVQEEAVNIV